MKNEFSFRQKTECGRLSACLPACFCFVVRVFLSYCSLWNEMTARWARREVLTFKNSCISLIFFSRLLLVESARFEVRFWVKEMYSPLCYIGEALHSLIYSQAALLFCHPRDRAVYIN